MFLRLPVLVLALLVSACTAFTLVPAKERITLGNGFSVQPGRAWARTTNDNEPNLKVWTMDGPLLNALGFVAGLENGASILKTPPGKEPMPVFRSAMGAPEVAELFEATLTRAAATGAIVKTSGLRPATFAGRQGFRFDFTFVRRDDDVERRGVAAGVVHEGKLYLVFFHGARIHYFPSVLDEAEEVIRSARIG